MSYYDDFGITKTKENLNDEMIHNLFKVPKKDKGVNVPHIDIREKDSVHQADLLFMPHDNGFKYALTVVDLGTGLTDAQAIRTKDSTAVLKGFEKIYSRQILNLPKRLEVDSGTEFKGVVKKYFDENNVFVRVGKTGRHRQQALVERRNQTISVALFKLQASQELLTGKENTKWVDHLPTIIEAINKKLKKKKPKSSEFGDPVCQSDACNLLDIGTKVRVILEEPISLATKKKVIGKFRSVDIRFHPQERIIKEILIRPNQPPMYLLDGDTGPRKVDPIAYTKNQLQVIPSNERLPPVIKGKKKS